MSTFQKASPLTIARRIVDRMLRDKATASEVAFLYDNPLLWLRALNRVREETENHLAKATATREHVKPGSGEVPSEEFKRLLAEGARIKVARLHFLNMVKREIEDVKALCGPDKLADRVTVGDLVDALVGIATLADLDDLQGVRDKSLFWATQIKQMAEAAPVGGAR